MTLRFGSLFAGIGGFDLGLERAGMECAWQIEIDPYCQRVLAKHWPNVERFSDVRECGKHNLSAVDLICGGFPCQPFSVAGKRRGKDDDRNLWPEMLRIVEECGPRWVVCENTPGIFDLYLDTVLASLESAGYEAWTVDIPAAGVGAWHRRNRIWIVAHTDKFGLSGSPTRNTAHDEEWHDQAHEPRRRAEFYEIVAGGEVAAYSKSARTMPAQQSGSRNVSVGKGKDVTHAISKRRNGRANDTPGDVLQRRDAFTGRSTPRDTWATEPGICRVAYGIPNRVDRLRALGNAVVPQVVELIGLAIIQSEQLSLPEVLA